MQLPKLSPLQSRLLAFCITTCLVVVLWICFQPNSFAYAAEIPVSPEVVQHSEFEASIPPAPPDDPPLEIRDGLEDDTHGDALYAPVFAYFDRSLVGRQEDALVDLNNNQMRMSNIAPNETKHFRFKKSQLGKRYVLEEAPVAQSLEESTNQSLRADGHSEEDTEKRAVKRQAQSRLWLSANTCRQPAANSPIISDAVPQLTMWIWTSKDSASPVPSDTNKAVGNSTFNSGSANFTVSTNDDVYVAVWAPPLPQGWDGSWQFEIAASIDEGYYHNYDSSTDFIFMVDTDSDSTLFITHNMTDFNDTDKVNKWIESHSGDNMPFDIYAFPDDGLSPMLGLERSYCGLKDIFETSNNLSVTTSITTQFGQGLPKGMFNVQGLKTATKYMGFLSLNATSNITIDGVDPKGGGLVFKSFQWQTKAGTFSSLNLLLTPLTSLDDSCQVIFGLEECSTVAYAVPSSPQWKNNDTGLIAFYDNQAKTYMANFRKSLAQIACDTAGTAQYSLARNCTDCEADYKAWLCSVLIPRCEDWTATDPWLHPRNINTPFADGSLPTDNGTRSSDNSTALAFNSTLRNRFAYNQSRNNEIDNVIKPGPYKELLPCEDLCFDIVRSCPAKLSFGCPEPPMRQYSYGTRDPSGRKLWCNFPGAVVNLNQDQSAAGSLRYRIGTVVAVVLFVAGWTWV